MLSTLDSMYFALVSISFAMESITMGGGLKAERRARNIVFVIVFTLPSNISSSQNIKHPHHHCHNFHHELCGKLSYKGTFSWMWASHISTRITGSGVWDWKCRLNIHHACVTTPLWIVSRVAKMSQSRHPHSCGHHHQLYTFNTAWHCHAER